MRICGKRASCYTQSEIALMLWGHRDANDKELTEEQLRELHKVYTRRKEVK